MVGTCIGTMTIGTVSSALTGRHRELLTLTIEMGEGLLLGGVREIKIMLAT